MKRCSYRIVLASLVTAQVALNLLISWCTGPGWDEWGHLPSGLYTLQYGDFHPYQVNPPLVRVLGSISVFLLGGGIDFQPLPKTAGARSELYLGVLYVHQHGADVFRWVSIARTAVLPIGIFGTALMHKVGKHFGGRLGGIFAASLWVFSPTVLTYTSAITPDVAAATFGFWATWCFYCWYRIGRTRDVFWLGVSIGVALLSKSTWIILPPVFLVTLVVLLGTERKRRRRSCVTYFAQFGLVALVAWIVVHAGYDFRGTLRPIGSFEFVSDALSGNSENEPSMVPQVGNRFRGTLLHWIPSPLPASYVQGIDIQKRDFEGNFTSYLCGEHSEEGWWHYYAIAWLIKEPLAFWLILVLGWTALACAKTTTQSTKRLGVATMCVPGIVVFLFVSSQTGFNHHLRYVLPAFPAAFLLASLPIHRVKTRTQIALVGLLIWFAASSVSMAPRTYAYFSEAVGGWRNGHRYLNSSNLDWGQDLPSIRRWTRENPSKRPVFLLYSLDQVDYSVLGIDARSGQGKVSANGPLVDGWWVVSISETLDEPHSWFLPQDPTERLSVSTTVYHVVDGKVVPGGQD